MTTIDFYPAVTYQVSSTGPWQTYDWHRIDRDGADEPAYIQTCDITIGKMHELDRFEASQCTLVVDNRDGSFNPWNTDSHFAVDGANIIVPGAPFRITATWGTVSYPIFFGFIESVTPNWIDPLNAEMTIVVTDGLKLLAAKYLVSGGSKIPGDQVGYYPEVGLNPSIFGSAWSWYRCGDPVGSTILQDYSGNGNNGLAAGSGAFGQNGPVMYDPTTAWATSGTDANYLVLPDTVLPTVIGTVGTTEWSIGIYVQTTSTVPGMLLYYGKFPTLGPSDQYVLFTLNPESGTTLSVSVGLGGPSRTMNHYGVLNDGRWHRIWVTGPVNGDGSTDVKLWVDGIPIQNLLPGVDEAVIELGGVGYVAGWPAGTTIPVSVPSLGDTTVAEIFFLNAIIDTSDVQNEWDISRKFREVETTGVRMKHIFDIVLYQFVAGAITDFTDLDTGTIYVQGENSTVTNRTALDYCQTLEQTEFGLFFQEATGVFRFLSTQYYITNPKANTSQFLFSDLTGLYYLLASTKITLDDLDLWNDAQVQAVTYTGSSATGSQSVTTGLLQEYADAASQIVYGARTLVGWTSLLFENDSDAYALATEIVARHGVPILRIEAIAVDNLADEGNNLTAILGMFLGWQFTVDRQTADSGLNYTGSHLVEQITHKIELDKWTTTFVGDPYPLVAADAFRFDDSDYNNFNGPGNLRY